MNTPLEQPQSARIAWLDTAKLIGIYLVILGHLPLITNENGQSFLHRWIYAFHMPLFFFLSGFVEKNRSFKETLARSVKNLLVPYVCFYLLTYAWWFVVGFLRHPELFSRTITDGFIKPMLGLFVGCGFDTDYSIMINVPLWFLVALFWCRLFAAVGNALGRWGKPLLCVVGMVISVALWKTNRFLPFSFGAACMAFPFYYAGTLARIINILQKERYVSVTIVMMLCSIGLLFLLTYLNGRVDINGIIYGKHPLLFFAGAVAGILMICAVSQLLPRLCAFGNMLAQNTITIVALHSNISNIVLKIYARFVLHIARLGEREISNSTGIVVALVVLLLCAIPCYVISRYFPWLLGRKNLRRACAGGDSV